MIYGVSRCLRDMPATNNMMKTTLRIERLKVKGQEKTHNDTVSDKTGSRTTLPDIKDISQWQFKRQFKKT